MADALAIELHPLATETTSGVSASVDIGAQRTCLQLTLEVDALSAASPPAGLAVSLQHAPSPTGPWEMLRPMPSVTAACTREILIVNTRRFVRAVWTLTGDATTFRLSGDAHTLLATPADVNRFAFPGKASESVDADVMATWCLASSEEAFTYIAGRFTPPLLRWGFDLRMHVAKMAGFGIMCQRGFQPGGVDELLVKGRDDGVAYLKMIGKNDLYPPAIVDSDPSDVGANDAFVIDAADSFWDAL